MVDREKLDPRLRGGRFLQACFRPRSCTTASRPALSSTASRRRVPLRRSLRPRPRAITRDGNGLYLYVQKTVTRSWIQQERGAPESRCGHREGAGGRIGHRPPRTDSTWRRLCDGPWRAFSLPRPAAPALRGGTFRGRAGSVWAFSRLNPCRRSSSGARGLPLP